MTVPNMNLSEARSQSVKPGAYKVRILGADVDTKYNRLVLKLDIADGEHQGYYRQLFEKYSFWGLTASLYFDKESAWKFANAIDAIRASNAYFEWNDNGKNDEKALVGMYAGAVLQKKHYIGNDGTEKSKLLVYRLISLTDLKTGNYKVPDDRYDDGTGPGSSRNASAGVVDTTADVIDTTAQMPEGFQKIEDKDIPF